ncbi:cytochrome P450 [Laetiporus sulphureus 93-53]|uniref:Cytochrome P450 n=1 Tax=Laetiporus sulphureus 93-53 TaxID=1314785 RepID=A0A165CPD7_9APHY|nr:cytochrome P450 [Laetiporus sulphureus 93-53]KZT03177.1 cytochrome P450 [Laetiporus sulphureus 93-53]
MDRKRRLPLPPGPSRLPFVGNVLQIPFDYQHVTFANWKKQYGDLIYARAFQQDVVVLNSTKAARDLLEKRGQKYSDRPRMVMFNELLYAFYPALPTMPYGERWRQHRGWYQMALQSSAAQGSYHSLQQKQSRRFFVELIHSPQAFMSHVNSRLIGSTLLEIGYGYDDDEFVRMAEKVNVGVFESGGPGATLVDFFPVLKYLPTWLPGAGFKRKALEVRDAGVISRTIPFERVKREMLSGVARPSFAQTLLEKADGSHTESFEFDLMGAAATLYGAGTDTTVATITSFLLAMVLNPAVFDKVQAEMDAVVHNRRLRDRDSLPYLECVLKEVYRWFAPVPLVTFCLPHSLVDADGFEGYYIPAGATVLANIWAMTRDPEIYYDPEVFRPERFQDVQPDMADLMDARKLVFGFGRRICPGRSLAESNVWLVAAGIMATMTVRKARDAFGNEMIPSVTFLSGTVSHPMPFQCDVRPRSEQTVALIMKDKIG